MTYDAINSGKYDDVITDINERIGNALMQGDIEPDDDGFIPERLMYADGSIHELLTVTFAETQIRAALPKDIITELNQLFTDITGEFNARPSSHKSREDDRSSQELLSKSTERLSTGESTRTESSDRASQDEAGDSSVDETSIRENTQSEEQRQVNYDQSIKSMEELTNHSGGAYGADSLWDMVGREFNVTNHKHYRASDNINLSVPLKKAKIQATVLTKEEINNARNEVNKLLNKNYQDNLQGNLQARNYYQVSNADAVYAIAKLSPSKQSVTGGTNTAIQLGIIMGKPVYVWDVSTYQWYVFDINDNKFTHSDVPILTANFAGVGTRQVMSYNIKDRNTGNWVQALT